MGADRPDRGKRPGGPEAGDHHHLASPRRRVGSASPSHDSARMHAARRGGEKGVPRKGDLSPLRLVYTPRTVEREYHKDFSQALGRDMELLHFGSSGRALLAFPTSMGRFYQWEDFGLIAAIAEWIDRGDLQVICVDSVDGESWYARG